MLSDGKMSVSGSCHQHRKHRKAKHTDEITRGDTTSKNDTDTSSSSGALWEVARLSVTCFETAAEYFLSVLLSAS